MGDTFSSQQEASFLQRLQFFESAEDPNYGRLQIYRMREPPYEYILDHRKTFVEDQERMKDYLKQGGRLRELQHKNLARVHACVVREDKQLCIIHRVVHTYCSYYNFTLAQAIGKKKATRNTFSEGDLLYLMTSLLDSLNYLHRHGLAFGQFRTESIYLSPEGHLKLYLLEIDPDYRHSAFHRVMAEHHRLGEYVLAPEQLLAVRKMDNEVKFNPMLADLFAVGMVMLELLTLDSARFYFNDQRLEVMLSKALFSIDIYQGRYSQQLLDAIRGCLAADPQQRPDPEELLKSLQELKGSGGRANVYCIRLEAEENKEKREEGPKPKGQYILNSLAKKLNPSPISTISSSSASLFRTTDPKSTSFRAKQPNSTYVKE